MQYEIYLLVCFMVWHESSQLDMQGTLQIQPNI